MADRLTPAALRSLAVALDAGMGLGAILQDRQLAAALPPAAVRALSTALRLGKPPGQSLRQVELLDDGEAAIFDAGVDGGALPEALRALAEVMEESARRQRRLLGAVAYPAFVLMAACVILPLPGIVTGGVGAWARVALPGLGLVSGLLALVFVVIPRSTPSTRARLLALVASLPVVGAVVVDDARAGGLLVLQRLLAAGMPVTLALPRALGATGLPRFAARATAATASLGAGGTLTAALRDAGLVTGDVAAMLEVAERTGSLDTALARLSPELQAQASRRFVALVVAGAVVLGVGVAVAIGWQVVAGFQGYLDTVDRVGRE